MADPIRVLHVDDDPSFTDVTATLLERMDERFRVETATGPEEALDRLAEHEVDCVVSDYEMPMTDGIEFLQAVREVYPELPFLLFTGKGSEEIASEAISAGVTDYLQKEGGTDQYTVLANRIENAVEKYRTEQELDATRNRYQQLVEQNLAGIYIIQDWEVAYVNPKIAEIFGYEQEELVGNSPIELIAPEERDRARENLRRRFEGEIDDIKYQTVARTRAGERIHVELHGSRIEYDGRPAIIGTLLNITERKEREQQLTQQQKRLSVALEGANAGVWEWDIETDEVIWHESTERLFGLEPGEFEDTYEAFASRVHDDGLERLEAAIEAALPRREPFEEEYRIRREDGEWRWVFARGEFVDIEELTPRYIGVVTDITGRKEREQNLERAKDRYRTLLEAAPDAVLVADVETGEIIETNEAATQLLGRPREEIVGMPQTKLHPPERAQEYAELFREHVQAGTGRDMSLSDQLDIHVITSEGEHVPVEISARVVEIGDETVIQGYFRDVTERKQYERELERQNDRLEEFASVVGHDLRNPLNVVESRLQLAKEEHDCEHFEPMERSLDRMDTLIDDLLTLAREGTQIQQRERIDLAEVVEDCWRNVETADATIEGDVDRRFAADPSRLRQLLTNLVQNAIKHGGTDVTITVGELADGFYVEDDGPGIPPDEREDVFDTGYSTVPEGVGFGLAIAEAVAEAHGWEIRATAGTEGGARFEVTGVEFSG
jgi:PAS domain S-box-containing protein